MARVIEARDPQAEWVTMSWRALANIFMIGLLIGLVTYALSVLLARFIFEPILCGDTVALVRCGSEDSFASSIATVLGSMIGLVFLVRERTFRPLLVILAVALALWTLFAATAALPWFFATIVAAITFGLAYALFAWFAQTNSLVVALVAITILVVIVRLVLTI